MKRLIAFLLALTMLFAISACGSEEPKPEKPKKEVDVVEPEKEPYEEKVPPSENAPEVSPEPEDVPVGDGVPDVPSTPEEKPAEKPAEKPTEKPSEKPVEKPAEPAEKPAEKPSEKPADVPTEPSEKPSEEKPSEKPSETIGDALAATFHANSGKSGQEIADAVIKNSVIPEELSLMTMEVEKGYLTGFDNTEITGFENGVMFAPMMGTIPFVGYVFTLPSTATVDAFANILKSSANLRWNICTEAEQMIVEKSGNKVFFLMCPKSFE